MKPIETILANLLGVNEHERTQVVLWQRQGASHIELRQQSFGDGVGWFTQSTINLDPAQIVGLRTALGVKVPPTPVLRNRSQSAPQVLRFEAAESDDGSTVGKYSPTSSCVSR